MSSVAFFVLASLVLGVARGLAPLDPRWKLTWNDEFNGTTLDTTKWSAVDYLGYIFAGEADYYASDHVSVANGSLILKTDSTPNWGQPYTSAKIHTSGKFVATYGRYEVFAAVPTEAGFWPAHWLVSEFRCWPYGMEIDILESIGTKSPNTAYGTVHLGKSCGDNNGQQHTANYNFSVGYHLFAVEWYPDHIAWFVDDYNYGNVSAATAYNNGPITLDNTPHYMILNTAVGAPGSWPGAPDPHQTWPVYHMIDYVRYYTWEPCVGGCGTNGCCEPTTQTCMCDAGFLGANCEYQNSSLYVDNFNALSGGAYASNNSAPTASYVEFLNSNVQFANSIMSLVMAPCPIGANSGGGTVTGPACDSGASYSSGAWSTSKYYWGGTFEFVMQTAPVANAKVLIVFSSGLGGAPESFQIQIDGATSHIYSQTYGPGNLAAGICDTYAGFNISDGFHHYKVEYVPNKSIIIYADSAVIGNLTTTYPYALSSAFSINVAFNAIPAYWGGVTLSAPISVNLDSFTYTPPVQKAVCSSAITTSTTTANSGLQPVPTTTAATSASGSKMSSTSTTASTPVPSTTHSPTTSSTPNPALVTTAADSEAGVLVPLASILLILFALL